ncbi:hypothetical protein, partial [Xylella fastidiosa]|uniref:hypothetical protein n=1 Tax=Xylella fastidiosa TaxID=2371 RepID=UPI0005706D30
PPSRRKTCGHKKTAWVSDAGTAEFGVSKLLTEDGTAAAYSGQAHGVTVTVGEEAPVSAHQNQYPLCALFQRMKSA